MTLTLVSSTDAAPSIALSGQRLPVVLGRSQTTCVPVPDPLVSRHHCELLIDDGNFVVRDLGSKNGTILNGQTVDVSELQNGDELILGDALFVVSIDASLDSVGVAAEAGSQHA